jgi:hypothetical protein
VLFLYARFSSSSLPLDLNPGSGTPNSPASPASPDPRAKRTNPLVDLIDTEKLYVEQLTGIIRVRYSFRLVAPSLALVLMIDTESCFGMVTHEPPSP